MRILFIEDHPHKREQVIKFIKEVFAGVFIETKESYNSGLIELISNSEEYDILLLDISMPNYDITHGEDGGDWMPLAGKQLLDEMYLRDIPTKAIVVTMHGSFDDGTRLTELDEDLRTEFSDNYVGYVYYSQIDTEWREDLQKLINKHKPNNDKNINS